MAYATFVRTSRFSVSEYASHLLASMKEAHARRAVYNRTFGELNTMTERDLADIGIARDQIEDIAREAAYGK